MRKTGDTSYHAPGFSHAADHSSAKQKKFMSAIFKHLHQILVKPDHILGFRTGTCRKEQCPLRIIFPGQCPVYRLDRIIRDRDCIDPAVVGRGKLRRTARRLPDNIVDRIWKSGILYTIEHDIGDQDLTFDVSPVASASTI